MPGPNASLTLSAFGEDCIKLWEEDSLSPKLVAYDDGAGTWTIGFGCTKGVHKGMTVTADQAEQMFQTEMQEFIAATRRRITVPLSQHQFDSLVSFLFNEGSAAGDSLVRAINAGDFDHVPSAFLLYTKARKGGKGPLVTWPGLVDRRNKEIALWSGTYKDHRIPSSSTALALVSPTAEEPSPLMAATVAPQNPIAAAAKSPTIWTLATLAWAKLGNGVEWVTGQLSSLVGDAGEIKDQAEALSSPIQSLLSTMKVDAAQIGTGIAVVCVIIIAVRHLDLKRGTS